MFSLRILMAVGLLTTMLGASVTAKQQANYDEAKVPKYELPDPLLFNDGSAVTTPEQWKKRRVEILELFSKNVYGVMPPNPDKRILRKRTKSVSIKLKFQPSPNEPIEKQLILNASYRRTSRY